MNADFKNLNAKYYLSSLNKLSLNLNVNSKIKM